MILSALKRFFGPQREPLARIDALDLSNWPSAPCEPKDAKAEGVTEFVVTGNYAVARSPRHIPWSRRRKELEASARQKRRHLESFREQA